MGWGAAGTALNLDAARQSVVMLQRGSLPWSVASGHTAVIGPLANSSSYLLGTYRGSICNAKQPCDAHKCEDVGCGCVLSVLSTHEAAGESCVFHQGIADPPDLVAAHPGDAAAIKAAAALASSADRVVLVLGNAITVANEGLDRTPPRLPTGTSLPGSQGALALAVLATGVPTTLMLVSGESLAIDALLSADLPHPPAAILYHAYPGGTGGTALVESLLGHHNRFGRLS